MDQGNISMYPVTIIQIKIQNTSIAQKVPSYSFSVDSSFPFMCVCSVMSDSFETPWTVAHQAPLVNFLCSWTFMESYYRLTLWLDFFIQHYIWRFVLLQSIVFLFYDCYTVFHYTLWYEYIIIWKCLLLFMNISVISSFLLLWIILLWLCLLEDRPVNFSSIYTSEQKWQAMG